MRTTAKNYFPATICASLPILLYFVALPRAEIGINDDWSYIKTASVLAQTGRLTYNEWGKPMLGWQAYFGALLIKLFGFSFTVVRFSSVIVAMATAFLLQRIFVRSGLNSWNATLATLTVVLSPLCLPLDYTFMNDIPGLFAILLCLYMCLRAVIAENDDSSKFWIVGAALSNVLAGTARQIAWLGVLVMVPSTLWLIRRKRRALIWGSLSFIAGACAVAAVTRWLARQPNLLPESAFPGRIDLSSLRFLFGIVLDSAGFLALLLLPELLMFAKSLRPWNRRKAAVFGIGMVCFALPEIASITKGGKLIWLAPFLSDYMTDTSFQKLNALAARYAHLSASTDCFQILLTLSVALAVLSVITCGLNHEPQHPLSERRITPSISWQGLGIILGPFTLAYICLLASLGLQFEFFDRFLFPLLVILALVVTRLYQERVDTKLPFACLILIALWGIFNTLATHDEFALYRGYASAIRVIRSTGAPATSILGPWEYDGWVEVGKIASDPGSQLPNPAYVQSSSRTYPPSCDPTLVRILELASAIKPVYTVSLNPRECGGQIAFPPVTYHTWIAPQDNAIYIDRLPSDFPK